MENAMKSTVHFHTIRNRAKGFSLIEVMVSMVVLTVGLLAVLASLGVALASNQDTQLDAIAREKASEALESIYSARQTGQITFDQIDNISGTGSGIFVSGWNTLEDAGPDGIDGTQDDIATTPIIVPGSSGVLTGSTPPDVEINLGAFQRQITITSPATNLKEITVSIRYPLPQGWSKTYTVQTLMSYYY